MTILLSISNVTYLKSGLAIAILIALSVLLTRFLKRCKSCGQWNSLYEADRVFDEYKWRKKIYRTTHRDSKGRVTGTTEREGREKYRIDRVTIECRNCNYNYTQRYEEGKSIGDSGVSLFVFGIIVIGIYLLGCYLGSDRISKKQVDVDNVHETSNKPSQHISSAANRVKDSVNTELNDGDKIKEVIVEPENQVTSLDTQKQNENSTATEVLANPVSDQITDQTPEEVRIEIAKKMLDNGMSLREVADSTFLTIRQVRKIRRSL